LLTSEPALCVVWLLLSPTKNNHQNNIGILWLVPPYSLSPIQGNKVICSAHGPFFLGDYNGAIIKFLSTIAYHYINVNVTLPAEYIFCNFIA
jgi:hypothetical protein